MREGVRRCKRAVGLPLPLSEGAGGGHQNRLPPPPPPTPSRKRREKALRQRIAIALQVYVHPLILPAKAREADADGRRFPQGGARLSPASAARETGDRADQAHGHPARPVARPIPPASPPPARRSTPIRTPRYDYTARGNLVGVISNGTAVLGLGNIGALAGKPVMEGKAVLFKKFAGIDVFDIEVDAADPARFCDVVAALEPTFGAINLEDIKAPECFAIEAELRRRMHIPVFHDDQHGTAITVAAAVRNGLRAAGQDADGREAGDLRRRRRRAGLRRSAGLDGAAAGERHADRHQGRGAHRPRRTCCPTWRATPATPTRGRCEDALPGADIFLGLSAPRVLKPEWLPLLAPKPLILALANPDPEILPELVTRRAPRRDRRHRAQRLSQPGQQRPVFPVHLPRRAGRVRHHDQRGDEDRRGGGDRRTRADGGQRGGRRRLWRCRAGVRSGLHHPQAVRSAADPARSRPRWRARRWKRRRAPADRRFRGLSARSGALRLPLRPAHAPGVRGCASKRRSASSMPRARTSACCARRRRWWMRASRSRSCSAAAR